MGKPFSNSFPLPKFPLEIGLTFMHVSSLCELDDDLVHFWSLVFDAHKLGYLRWLSMRTTIDCAWMFDGATKDRVYTLSLASRLRVYMRWKPYGWIGPEGRDGERNDVEMVE
ncbi:hypothetical protein PIB30_023880 [Stylosanthes scabra]|uniref:Uncharacterized protein n=1 Tax=Stylosanthes scabra TaxID=79078 RepID=A0ABU6TBJ8_9FABA|nr:hypothetical protein [Stylosanthes scabra]